MVTRTVPIAIAIAMPIPITIGLTIKTAITMATNGKPLQRMAMPTATEPTRITLVVMMMIPDNGESIIANKFNNSNES